MGRSFFSRCQLSLLSRVILNQIVRENASFSTFADSFIENLTLEELSKREMILLKYFRNNTLLPKSAENRSPFELSNKNFKYMLDVNSTNNLVNYIVNEFTHEDSIPSERLIELLIYFAKNGHISGVKAVQSIIQKHNSSLYNSQSGYGHYLAEALWINGKIEDSLKLFNSSYNNKAIRPKVKSMLIILFSFLTEELSDVVLHKAVNCINCFCIEKCDYVLMAFLWKELFKSSWYSNQQFSNEFYEKNKHLGLLQVIQWLIPTFGKELLKEHRIEDFYRLIQFSLENNLKNYAAILIRTLFDYYYIHQNIKRCSAIVKFASDVEFELTEEQHRRYIKLLLKDKDSVTSTLNVRKSQSLKYKF